MSFGEVKILPDTCRLTAYVKDAAALQKRFLRSSVGPKAEIAFDAEAGQLLLRDLLVSAASADALTRRRYRWSRAHLAEPQYSSVPATKTSLELATS